MTKVVTERMLYRGQKSEFSELAKKVKKYNRQMQLLQKSNSAKAYLRRKATLTLKVRKENEMHTTGSFCPLHRHQMNEKFDGLFHD